MNTSFKSLCYALLGMGILAIVGCSESSELGLSLVEQETSDIILTDTVTVALSTVEAIPDVTSNRAGMTCGSYVDPEWGTTNASISLNFRLQNIGATFPNTVFDSIVLTLAYEQFGHYGELRAEKPTPTAQNWEVVRLTESILEDTDYRSDATFATEATPLKSNFSFTPSDTLPVTVDGTEQVPHLRIRLDDPSGIALGQTFLKPQGADTVMYESNTAFKNWFKGLQIRPSSNNPANGSLVRFEARAAMTRLWVYYRDTSNGGNVAETLEFVTNEDAEWVTSINHIHPADLTDNLPTDTIVYVQGGDGLHTKVSFPYVQNFDNIIVNKAELIVTVQDTGSTAFALPPQLVAQVKDAGGNLVVIDDIATSIIKKSSYIAFEGMPQVTTNRVVFYRMQIAEEMQNFVEGKTIEPAIYLSLPSPIDPERVKLINHRGVQAAKLNFTYTRLPQ